ncbi:TolC family protein [Sphingobium sp. 3R8]|uniref:TolC family protein n=1 Tax=Sphingobium sp. 3R8 TaxID=2874921 RepID=UPI001CCCF7C4|nr:TolC family protein [Sphingobium sp. 3R8]MBZ9646920.1 TolC family protein [Sphingobium sp. 3R8]
MLMMTGCAHYAPEPLIDTPDILAAPAAVSLVRPYGRASSPPTQAINLSAPLDEDAIAALAVTANPDLKALRARNGVNDAQVFSAGLMPDPTFSLGIDPILSGADPVAGLASALGLDLNALRTRAVARQQALAQQRQARMDLVWAEWQTAGQARLQAVRIAALEAQSVVARDSLASAQHLLARYGAAASRGDVSADPLQGARIAALDAQQVARQAEKDLAVARLELNRLLGLPPTYPLRIAPVAAFAPRPDADQLFALARQERSDLRALREGYDAQEAALRKAILDQFPTLDLTINGGRDTGRNVTLGPAIGFTLPLWNRNRGGIAIEKATRAALKAEYEARLFQTRAEIAAAVAALAIARRQYTDLDGGLAEATRQAEASRRAATRGDLPDATARAAEQILRDRQLLRLHSAQDMAEQAIALELLTGATREQWQ